MCLTCGSGLSLEPGLASPFPPHPPLASYGSILPSCLSGVNWPDPLYEQLLCLLLTLLPVLEVFIYFFMFQSPPVSDFHEGNKATAHDTCAHYGLRDCNTVIFCFLLFDIPLCEIQHESNIGESENNRRGIYQALPQILPPG